MLRDMLSVPYVIGNNTRILAFQKAIILTRCSSHLPTKWAKWQSSSK